MLRRTCLYLGTIALTSSLATATEVGQIFVWGSVDPMQVPSIRAPLQVEQGADFGAVLAQDGTVHCWGGSSWSGDANPPSGLLATQIACGSYHTVAKRTDGSIVCWGSNNENQCAAPSGLAFRSVHAGINLSLAVRADGTLAAWGRYYPYSNSAQTPSVPYTLNGVRQASAGYSTFTVLRENGRVYAFGGNSYNEATVPAGLTATQIASGYFHSIALTNSRTVVCWGDGRSGQCDVPAYVQDVVAVDAGDFYSVALLATGAVECWGSNGYGQCMPPIELTSASSISAGPSQAAAVAGAAPPVSCPGDFDGDGEVTTADISLLLLNFGPCS